MAARMVRRRAVVGTAMGVAVTANAVSSARKNRAEREYIENANDANAQAQQQQVADPQAAAQPAAVDPTVELQKYAQLKDQGVITQEEFDAKKKQLLGL